MKQIIISTLFLSLLSVTMMGQNVFELTDLSDSTDVFAGGDIEAGVRIRCHKSIPLSFSSTKDISVRPWSTGIEGTDSIYYLSFPTGRRYSGRILSVYSPGYRPLEIELELNPKQLCTFQIFDPNSSIDAGCYRTHRNKGLEEFKGMNYEAARALFVTARECSDVDSVENESNINSIDSLLYHRKLADDHFLLLEYMKAQKEYLAASVFNPYDSYLTNRANECEQKSLTNCQTYFNKAEYYFKEKEYDKALELYQKVVGYDCSQSPTATLRINDINAYKRRKKDHANVFTYEFTKNIPIGIHFGRYNMHKVGGFFALNMNGLVFKAMQKDCGIEDYPELSLKAGWTVKIANPVWIYFGPGIVAKMWYGKYYEVDEKGEFIVDSSNTKTNGYPMNETAKIDPQYESMKNEDLPANVGFAVPVTVGLTVKYSYFAIRVGYEYRFSFKKQLVDFMGKSRITFGVGVAF